MPAEIPLFLVPAFAGIPEFTRERLAIKKAKQQASELIELFNTITKGDHFRKEVLSEVIVTIRKTLLALSKAIKNLKKYKDKRPATAAAAEIQQLEDAANEFHASLSAFVVE